GSIVIRDEARLARRNRTASPPRLRLAILTMTGAGANAAEAGHQGLRGMPRPTAPEEGARLDSVPLTGASSVGFYPESLAARPPSYTRHPPMVQMCDNTSANGKLGLT